MQFILSYLTNEIYQIQNCQILVSVSAFSIIFARRKYPLNADPLFKIKSYLLTHFSTASHQPSPLEVFPSSLLIRALTLSHRSQPKATILKLPQSILPPRPFRDNWKVHLLPGVHRHHHVEAAVEGRHMHSELLVALCRNLYYGSKLPYKNYKCEFLSTNPG